MPIRIREAADLLGCVAVLRRVHEISGYPSNWPEDRWRITPRGMVAAWVAEHGGLIAGHVALVRNVRLDGCCAPPASHPARWVASPGFTSTRGSGARAWPRPYWKPPPTARSLTVSAQRSMS